VSALLPENMEQVTIADMRPGEHGYTVPWSMWADNHRQLWLNPRYTWDEHAHGTASMRVERKADGFHVWPPPDYRYPTHQCHPYLLSGYVEFLPVAELHQ
jgi:hypothetical protein